MPVRVRSYGLGNSTVDRAQDVSHLRHSTLSHPTQNIGRRPLLAANSTLENSATSLPAMGYRLACNLFGSTHSAHQENAVVYVQSYRGY